MPDRIFQAVVTRWDAKNLDATFPGSVHFDLAPSGVSYPYVVMTLVGAGPDKWASNMEIRAHDVQFSIFQKEAALTDPVIAMGTLMRALDDAIGFAPLTLVSESVDGVVLEVRRTGEDIDRDEEGVWRGILEYTIRRMKPVTTFSPS